MLGSDSNNRGALTPGMANFPGVTVPGSPYAPGIASGSAATPDYMTSEAAVNIFMKKENLTQLNAHIRLTAQNVNQFRLLFATLHA